MGPNGENDGGSAMSAAPPTRPFALTTERVMNPFTGSVSFMFRIRDRFHRSVGCGEGADMAAAKASGESLKAHLEAPR